jgi:hypothetical protein
MYLTNTNGDWDLGAGRKNKRDGRKVMGGTGVSGGKERKEEKEKKGRERNVVFETGQIFWYRICATICASDLFSLLIV